MDSIIHSAYFSDNPEQKSLHYHDCHQIIFIKKGIVDFYVNNTKLTAKSGDIAIFSKHENHSSKLLSGEYERYVLRTSPLLTDNDSNEFLLFSNRPSGFENIFHTEENADDFEYMFKKIIKEKSSGNVLTSQMQQTLVKELLIMIYRLRPGELEIFDNRKNSVIFDIQRLFEKDCSREYTLEELSKDFHIGTSSLSHLFKEVTGYSVFEYLKSCRLTSAKNHLAKTNLSISEIVEKCGFSDHSNFSRMFKKATGLSPNQFRKTFGDSGSLQKL